MLQFVIKHNEEDPDKHTVIEINEKDNSNVIRNISMRDRLHSINFSVAKGHEGEKVEVIHYMVYADGRIERTNTSMLVLKSIDKDPEHPHLETVTFTGNKE